MKYSFAAITFAILATTLHASPMKLQYRDVTSIEEVNVAYVKNLDMIVPHVPRAATPTEAPFAGPDTPSAPTEAPGSPPAAPSSPTELPLLEANAPASPAEAPAPPANAPMPPTEAPPPPTNGTAPAPPTSASITDAPSAGNMTNSSNSTTSSTPNTPGTILPGTTPNCSTFYTVVMGDTCIAVGAKNGGISFEALKGLNTGIDATCSNLVVGQMLCVKV